jgi:hypothetical protein
MPDDRVPSHQVPLDVPTYSKASGLPGWWDAAESVSLRIAGNEIVICANVSGLQGLARDLLALAQDGVPDGTEVYRMSVGQAPTLAEGSPALRLVRR